MTNKERLELMMKMEKQLESYRADDNWLVSHNVWAEKTTICVFMCNSTYIDDNGEEKIASVKFDLDGVFIDAAPTLTQEFIDEATAHVKYWLAIDDIDTANQDR